MICSRCGAELFDDAVFCDKCGTLVLREDEFVSEPIESAGKRKRKHSSFWLFFRFAAWGVIIIAGITACVLGYMRVRREQNQRMYGQPDIPIVTESATEAATEWHPDQATEEVGIWRTTED